MAKLTKKSSQYMKSMREALGEFDLKKLLKWVQKYNPPLYRSLSKADKTVQMATMCKMICNRTDMLGTEAHKKAVKWLSEHDMKGRLF